MADHEQAGLCWAFGFDHAGYRLARQLQEFLIERGDRVLMFGPTDDLGPVDYPPFCIAAATAVVNGDARFGLVIGGSGQGEQIAANKVPGIRAALCTDPQWALMARRDNDANVLALAGRMTAPEYALQILERWIETEFEGGRHARRIGLIDAFEAGEVTMPVHWEGNPPGGSR